MAYARNVTLFLLFIGKLVDGLGAVLKTPEVLETCISTAHDVSGHDVGSDGEIQASETAGHRHTHETGLAAEVEIFLGAVGIDHASVFDMGALGVHAFCVFSDFAAADFSNNFKHLLV